MKKKNQFLGAFALVAIPFCLLLVFQSKIETKPSDAGFWMIFVFGMSVGVAITRLCFWYRNRNKV